MLFSVVTFLFVLPIGVQCLLGVDVSTSVPTTDWSCLKSHGYTFAIVRVLRSNGQVDTNSAATIHNGISAGLTMYSYAYPCSGTTCPSASSQIQSTITYLTNNNLKPGGLWLDIEGNQWSTNSATNINFIQQMVNELHILKVNPLIYSKSSDWQRITGNSKSFSRFELWYAHYDNNANFNDFASFGGWSRPNMKQYQENQNICQVGVDLNYAQNLPDPSHATNKI